MKSHTSLILLSLLLASGFAAPKKDAAPADRTGKSTVVPVAVEGKASPGPWRSWLPEAPVGRITLGAMASKDAVGVYLDGTTGLWAPESRDAFLFLDSRWHWEDHGQFITSTGLAVRKLLPGHEVIIGGNVFWDAIHSERGNDLDQLGLGFEVLTRWVDFRFNYYLPEDDRFVVGRNSSRRAHTDFSPGGFTRTTTRSTFTRFESGLEGFNTEIGVLIPGLDKYAEVRAYAGYYHYENPFGGDFDGFKARVEARLLRGVTANVEYWHDERLMGGHWTGKIAVSLPFSLHNLFTGRNPFSGAGDAFQRLPRPFSDRMSDMIERSHRIQTVTSGDILTGRSVSRRFTPIQRDDSGGNGSGGGTAAGGGFPIE